MASSGALEKETMEKETAVGGMMPEDLADATTTASGPRDRDIEETAAAPPVSATDAKPEFKEGGYGW